MKKIVISFFLVFGVAFLLDNHDVIAQQSCDAPYTLEFKAVGQAKWCGSYFTFWQTCEFKRDAKCPCATEMVEEAECI